MFSNWMTPTPAATNAPPPDVILEVGPPPFARYAAHSVLLAAHSGYLRSAMRPDSDRKYEAPIYLPSITADQFGPLLTYMYTGFLDLNSENIFAVLLASHVLHMPRASEICRAYLARAQSENYLGGIFESTTAHQNDRCTKIVRPIASKASASGLSFVAPPISTNLVPSTDTPFKSLLQSAADDDDRSSTPIVVTDPPDTVYVDVIRVEPPVKFNSTLKNNKQQRCHNPSTNTTTTPNKKGGQFDATTSQGLATICEVTQEPVKFIENNSRTTIIDIASCDGPVRFRRVLNEAYGRGTTSTVVKTTTPVERTHQNVAISFHAQMAKTISEQQQQQNHKNQSTHSTTENNVQDMSATANSQQQPTITTPANQHHHRSIKPSEELYSCVYCKHTFKSQYCYQKHAKRHINPLTIDDTTIPDNDQHHIETLDSDSDDKRSNSAAAGCRKKSTIRREVRPLDMNVQYYPCKTCGSKFPSYYFVHKHRKLCHANEDN